MGAVRLCMSEANSLLPAAQHPHVLLRGVAQRLSPTLICGNDLEKVVLMTYVDRQKKTRYFEIENGLVMGLVRSGILYRATEISSPQDMIFGFNLQPWAWVELQKHPELLELPKGVDPRSIDIGEADD